MLLCPSATANSDFEHAALSSNTRTLRRIDSGPDSGPNLDSGVSSRLTFSANPSGMVAWGCTGRRHMKKVWSSSNLERDQNETLNEIYSETRPIRSFNEQQNVPWCSHRNGFFSRSMEDLELALEDIHYLGSCRCGIVESCMEADLRLATARWSQRKARHD